MQVGHHFFFLFLDSIQSLVVAIQLESTPPDSASLHRVFPDTSSYSATTHLLTFCTASFRAFANVALPTLIRCLPFIHSILCITDSLLLISSASSSRYPALTGSAYFVPLAGLRTFCAFHYFLPMGLPVDSLAIPKPRPYLPEAVRVDLLTFWPSKPLKEMRPKYRLASVDP